MPSLPWTYLAMACSLVTGALGQYQNWALSLAAADRLLANLTLAEIANITAGQNVKGVFAQTSSLDGPNGVNTLVGVSSFVVAQTAAMSWDRDLIETQYAAMAEEFKAKGYGGSLGPVTGPLGRSVKSGRLFEGFGSDPYLNGKLFASAVTALQKNGVVSTGKHFLGNEQETNRSTYLDPTEDPNKRTSSNIDDRTTHELYLWPWIDGVAAGLGSVMCVMNRVNGSFGCQNHYLLTELLKGEVNFQGQIVPDATAVVDPFAALNAGLDNAAMAGGSGKGIMAAINNGTVSEKVIREAARRVVAVQLEIRNGSSTLPSPLTLQNTPIRDPNTKTVIRTVGAHSIVLLKNKGNALPFRNPKNIAVFGADAINNGAGPTWVEDVATFLGDTYPAHLVTGGGSGSSSSPYIVSPLDALTSLSAQNASFEVKYIATNNWTVAAAGPQSPLGNPQPTIAQWAGYSDTCLVFINAYSKEGADRESLSDAEQDTMVKNVAKYCNNTIVVMNTVGARIVDAWIDHPNVTAVLNAGALGEESGNAIMDVLFGAVNPAGRLPYTIAHKESDYNGDICPCCECDYVEGLFIDYRHFDKAGINPRFEFGFGLSYTTFNYSGATASLSDGGGGGGSKTQFNASAGGPLVPGGPGQLFDTVATASVTVKNTGAVRGDEVVQLYVSYPPGSGEPVNQLRGFTRLHDLKPGASAEAGFTLQRRDLSVWDVSSQTWTLLNGTYRIHFGKSSRQFEGGSANLTLNVT
ncbi:uncharacterized protein PV06_00593 [Exophiala oligosperma]|uniref:Probable beta-glucosidase M n=1 Tax=Exophiala oligosperma TaxID=215243 RepID=A0A0D2DZE6_9EURO|nr:uncharacterized protein PV06_00593 [Exophiala oligosperma]KIW47945.1 hypothetical protein PV06_00593 [Exophiala oligosperma]